MQFFKSLLKMLASQWGENCEIVLHDWSQGYDKTIVAIENGHITGRKVGDCGSNLGLEVMRGTVQDGDRYNYVTQTENGKTLKSSTMYIKNDSGKAIGALCINVDISNLIIAQRALADLVVPEKNEVSEYFASNVNDLLGFLIKESIKKVGKPVNNMTKEDKMEMLRFLDEKGAFLISKSGVKICKVMDISKYTLYSYLDEIHNSHKDMPYPEFE
jgi:predicted transcriptional regulator YheO